MPVLVVSAFVWLFIAYVVMPILEFITAFWPLILGGVVVFAVAAIYQAFREKGASPQNRGKAWSMGPSGEAEAFILDGHERQTSPRKKSMNRQPVRPTRRPTAYVYQESGAGSFKDWSAARGDNKAVTPRAPITRSILEAAPSGVPIRGLVIMEEPLSKILQGRKTMELRSKHNRQLGLIALIRKGSGKIYGVAEIVESIGPMSFDEFRAHSHEHAVEPERLREIYEMGWNHGWRLRNVVTLKSPVSYIHKGMSQVKLDPGAIEALSRQLAGV